MSSASVSTPKAVPSKGKAKGAGSSKDLTSARPPATFIIDPLSMMDLPQEVFDRYVLTLQICNFNYSNCDFDGSLAQIDALERNITLCDVILAGLVLDKFGIERFVRNKLIVPRTAKDWINKLRDDAAAVAKALIPVAIKEFEDDIASGRLPAWIAGDSWCGVGFDSPVEPVRPVSPETLARDYSQGRSDGAVMDWAAEVAAEVAAEATPSKRPRSRSSSAAASETANVSVEPSSSSFASIAAKPPKKKPSVVQEAKPEYTRTQLRELRNRRKARVQPLLKTAARAEACQRAQTSRMSAAKVGVTPTDVQKLINAFIGDDTVSLIRYSAKLYQGVPCELVTEKDSCSYYIEDIHCWRSFPSRVKTLSVEYYDAWRQSCQ